MITSTGTKATEDISGVVDVVVTTTIPSTLHDLDTAPRHLNQLMQLAADIILLGHLGAQLEVSAGIHGRGHKQLMVQLPQELALHIIHLRQGEGALIRGHHRPNLTTTTIKEEGNLLVGTAVGTVIEVAMDKSTNGRISKSSRGYIGGND